MQTTTRRQRLAEVARRHPHLGALGLFAVVICGIYAPVLEGARSLLTNGPWSQPLFVLDPLAGGPATAPLTRLSALSWHHLQLPVIDPFQGFGIPLLVNQGVPVYPPQLLFHLAFPGNYSIWNVVNLVVLAFGVYLLARSFGQRFFGAVAAGFLAALAGAAPPNVNMSMLNPLAVLPFALVAIRYAIDPDSRHRVSGLLGTATAIALLSLSGFQEVLPLLAVVIVVYAVALIVHFRTWYRRPLLMVGTVASALAGGVVGSVGILPALAVVGSGTTVNVPGDYLPHVPVYWLSTLTLPTITGRALNQAPLDLGNAVYTLGTPLLVLVVVLALSIALRPGGRGTRWYVFPSIAMVVYGVLGYADIGHVLQAFDIPLFDAIQSRRFLPFLWWIPLCLLLGAVVTNARVLRWKDVLLAVLAAAAFDAYFFERYRQALAASHLPGDSPAVLHAALVAGATVVVFAGAALAARRFGQATAGVAMVLVVLASCVYDLPTNFPPSSYGTAVATVRVPAGNLRRGNQLIFFGTRQLPTQQYSFQVYGPVLPQAYRSSLAALFTVQQAGGLDPIGAALPTLAELTLTRRAVSVLRSFGVDLLVVPDALAATRFPTLRSCGSPRARTRGALLCLLGRRTNPAPDVAYAPSEEYAYRVLGADALVDRSATPVPVASTGIASSDFTRQLSASVTALPTDAYVTSGAARLHAARNVRGVSRQATSESVSITVHSRSAGLVVLREGYQPGTKATVDGRRVAASPVDGGLWTAVQVGRGTSRIVLDYATTADLAELGIGVAGLVALALAWLALAAWAIRRRAGARGGGDRHGGPRHVAGRRAAPKTAATSSGVKRTG